MPLSNKALAVLENHLPKVIGPRAHGNIDYLHVAAFALAGLFFWKRNKKAAVAAFATSGAVLAESLLTDYPLGVKPVLSFETHGRLDQGLAAGAMAIPHVFGFAGEPEAWFFRANGVLEAAVVGMTDFDSARAHMERLAA